MTYIELDHPPYVHVFVLSVYGSDKIPFALGKEAAEKQQQENDKKNAAKEKVLVSGMSND